MTRPSPIRKSGLNDHLNTSKEQHRGLGYDMYKMFRACKVSRKARARLFKVTVSTMSRWDKHFDDEIREEE